MLRQQHLLLLRLAEQRVDELPCVQANPQTALQTVQEWQQMELLTPLLLLLHIGSAAALQSCCCRLLLSLPPLPLQQLQQPADKLQGNTATIPESAVQ